MCTHDSFEVTKLWRNVCKWTARIKQQHLEKFFLRRGTELTSLMTSCLLFSAPHCESEVSLFLCLHWWHCQPSLLPLLNLPCIFSDSCSCLYCTFSHCKFLTISGLLLTIIIATVRPLVLQLGCCDVLVRRKAVSQGFACTYWKGAANSQECG